MHSLATGLTELRDRVFAKTRDDPPRAPWLSDAPVDLDTELDAFGVDPIIDNLLKLIQSADPPFTMSLSGVWGSGKSTVAKGIVKRMRRAGGSAVLVDAWTEDLHQLRRTLVIAVAAAMRGRGDDATEERERKSVARRIDDETRNSKSEPATGTRAGVGLTLRAIFRDPVGFTLSILVVGALLLAISFLAPESAWSRAITPVLGVFIGFLLVNSGFFFVVRGLTVTTGPAEASEVLSREFRTAVSGEGMTDAPGRALVVVDNLDRLPGEDAVRALAEIRSLVEAQGSRCLFLIPVDREALVGHLKGAFSPPDVDAPSSQTQETAANDYLDKFFNLDIVLTQPQVIDIRMWALTQARKILEASDESDLVEAVQIVAFAAGASTNSPGGTSPRTVKRLLNGISTRARLLSPGVATLRQIALVECIVTQFPSLARWMSQDPRRFVVFRQAMAEGNEADRAAAIKSLPPAARRSSYVGVAEFLSAFRDIEIETGELASILSLRGDRDWPGVGAPEALRSAILSGDPTAFRAALDSTPPEEHDAVFRAAIAQLESSSGIFHRDALLAITALVPAASGHAFAAASLYRRGVEAMAKADESTLARLTLPVGAFLFDPTRAHRDLQPLAERVADAIVMLGSATSSEEHVRLVILAAPYFGTGTTTKVRVFLSELAIELQTPLFEVPLAMDLVHGPVIDKYIDLVAMGQPDMTAALADETLVRRLEAYRRGGGTFGTSLTQIAARFQQMAATVTEPAPPEYLDIVDAVASILRAATDPAIDSLASALAARTTTSRGRHFRAALQLETSAPVRQSIVSQFDAWVADTTTPASEIAIVLDARRDMLEASSSTWIERLITQWTGRSDGEDFLGLIKLHGGDEGADAAVDAVAARPNVEANAVEFADLFADDAPRLQRLVGNLSGWEASATPAQVEELADAAARIHDAGVAIYPLLEPIVARAKAGPASEVASWLLAAKAFDDAGIHEAQALAEALVEHSAAVGVADPSAAEWLAQKAQDKNQAALVVAAAITNTANTVSNAVALASRTRAKLDRKAPVGYALIQRAKASIAAPSEVEALLDEALSWRRQPADLQTDYQALLSQIADALPEMDARVVTLKNRGKKA